MPTRSRRIPTRPIVRTAPAILQLIPSQIHVGCRSAATRSPAAMTAAESTPISLMTSVNDFELFHTISGGLRYRHRGRASERARRLCRAARTIKPTRARPFALWKDALPPAAFYRADPRFRVLAALVDERRSRLCPRGPEDVCKQMPRDDGGRREKNVHHLVARSLRRRFCESDGIFATEKRRVPGGLFLAAEIPKRRITG